MAAPGQILVDLACGRGGYGREVARRTGGRLVGLGFSAVAVTIAAHGGPRGWARFCVGDFTALGLLDHSAVAVMCIDAIQFSDPPLAALRECRRVLASGGRLTVTAWEPCGPPREGARAAPPDEPGPPSAPAGFRADRGHGEADWYAAERTLWEAALQADAIGDPAPVSLHEEATQVLAGPRRQAPRAGHSHCAGPSGIANTCSARDLAGLLPMSTT